MGGRERDIGEIVRCANQRINGSEDVVKEEEERSEKEGIAYW